MSKLRKSAKGQQCQVRIPGVCNHNPETVVLAHLNGGGMATKHLDIHGAYCCSDCHDAIDGRRRTVFDPDVIKLWFFEGMVRTQRIMVGDGLIQLK